MPPKSTARRIEVNTTLAEMMDPVRLYAMETLAVGLTVVTILSRGMSFGELTFSAFLFAHFVLKTARAALLMERLRTLGYQDYSFGAIIRSQGLLWRFRKFLPKQGSTCLPGSGGGFTGLIEALSRANTTYDNDPTM